MPLAKEGPDNVTKLIPYNVAVITHRNVDPASLKSCIKSTSGQNLNKSRQNKIALLSPSS